MRAQILAAALAVVSLAAQAASITVGGGSCRVVSVVYDAARVLTVHADACTAGLPVAGGFIPAGALGFVLVVDDAHALTIRATLQPGTSYSGGFALTVQAGAFDRIYSGGFEK